MKRSRLEIAMEYASRGISLAAVHRFTDRHCCCPDPSCNHPGKHPIGGVHTASRDPKVLQGRFGPTGQAAGGIAAALGPPSGVMVLDVEARGVDALAQLEAELGPCPTAPIVLTGGWGRHYHIPPHPPAH